ncbi:MAG: hypothetical protein AB7G52_10420 [Arcobacter sp.]
MPKGSKLDRCRDAVENLLLKKVYLRKKLLEKRGVIVRKNVFENSNIDKVIKEAEKELKELEHE